MSRADKEKGPSKVKNEKRGPSKVKNEGEGANGAPKKCQLILKKFCFSIIKKTRVGIHITSYANS